MPINFSVGREISAHHEVNAYRSGKITKGPFSHPNIKSVGNHCEEEGRGLAG